MKTNYRCLRPQRLWNTINLVIYNLLTRTCQHLSWRHFLFVWMKYQMSRMKKRKGGERRGWGLYSPVQGRNTTQVTIIFEINAKQRRERGGVGLANTKPTHYLRGEADIEREWAGLRTGERLRRRGGGDLLGGLRARLGGDLNKIEDSLRIIIITADMGVWVRVYEIESPSSLIIIPKWRPQTIK